MVFNNKQKCILDGTAILKLDTETINKEKCIKFLGLLIDDQLQWTHHLQHCKSKIASSLYAINSVKHILFRPHLKSLYYALVHPYIDYGILLWRSALKRHTRPLVTLQKKAVRIINGAEYNAHTGPLFKSSKILTLEDMYNMHNYTHVCTNILKVLSH